MNKKFKDTIMIKIINNKNIDKKTFSKLFNRFGEDYGSALSAIIPIVNDVRKTGDAAVKKYTRLFDKVILKDVIATQHEIETGYKNIDKNVLNAFKKAKANIEEFHLKQKKKNIEYKRKDGSKLGVVYHPIQSAAVYVPGGKASYPSTVLMSVIPAQIAGVSDITVITPPDKSGSVSTEILAVCKLLGISTILKAGGAQGIAAAGFGTQSARKADIIVGPGNIYVTAAKAYLFSLGVVQIDSMAGPSEVLIIADNRANAKWIAYDMLSQAEHEERAAAILVTTSRALAESVKREIIKDLDRGQGRIEIRKKAVKDNALIIITEDINEAIDFSNKYAPEHMELMVKNPDKYLPQIKNVGSLFLGDYSPVAVGDYYSGTNHILPTGGSARFSSGVGVDTFLRRMTFQNISSKALKTACEPVNILSEAEGFKDKHGGSVSVRFDDKLNEE